MALRRDNHSVASLVALAILVGVLVGFGLSTAGYGAKFQFLSQSLPGQTMLSEEVIWYNDTVPPPPQSPLVTTENEELQYLADMVAKTNGFYARDYSLTLGYNNMRYIMEAAILHGRVLNRTTILPSFVYARACEFDIETCAAFVTMVNRGDAVHSDEWRDLPVDEQMAWRIPISVMFNLTHLQQSHPVITTTDYLRLHNISVDVETTAGEWDVDTYHVRDATGDMFPSLHVMQNDWFDPFNIARVDYLPQDMRLRGGWSSEGGDPSRDQPGSWTNPAKGSEIYDALMDSLPGFRPVLDWGTVQRIVTDGERITPSSSVEEVGDVLRENGFEVLYTFGGTVYGGITKDVVSPVPQAAPRNQIRGLCEDLNDVSARVLLVRGELHGGRSPGSLYFTSAASRSRFAQTVLYDMSFIDEIHSLAERISHRMFAMNDGRLWMAGHMRRGDFAKLGWTLEADFAAHLARIKDHLQQEGRDTLVSMHGGNVTTYDVPHASPDPLLAILDPPQPNDKYYIATDERDPDNLQYLRDQGAILISDLLTPEDHREYGWPILVTDVLALVEQSIMSRAAYYYGYTYSSVTGGVLNLRGSSGKDPRTAYIEWRA